MRLIRPLVAAGIASVALWGCGSDSATPKVPPTTSTYLPQPTPSPSQIPAGKIDHVVIVFQENRSTDNMFNGFPGADTVTSGLDKHGNTVQLQPIPLEAPGDLDHSQLGFTTDYDGGKMDGWSAEGRSSALPPNAPYAYVPQAEVAPDWAIAEQYVFADRMFQTNEGPSWPAHQFIIAGTSAPSESSPMLASQNPVDPGVAGNIGGCDSPAGSIVQLINAQGQTAGTVFPCFDHQTLMDLLDAKGITWKYYEPQIGGFWDGPDAIAHIRDNPADWSRVVEPETTIFTDITNGTLPQVSWVIPHGGNSDHSGSLKSNGPAWVASIVNSLGESPYWKSTVVFVTWDDWGGWYDHVKPPIYGPYELSFRVPLIVASPYAKHGYVSHTQHEFGSILRFVEENWNLGSLGFTDVRSDDFSDCFDFSQTPAAFKRIPSPLSASYFIRTKMPFIPPDTE